MYFLFNANFALTCAQSRMEDILVNKFTQKIKNFGESQSGSTAIMFGLLFTTVMGAVGFAVDYERAQNERKIVQDHLDATLIHLGRSEHKNNPQEPGTQYLLASLDNAKVEIGNLKPTFTYDAVEGSITGRVGITPRTIISGGILPKIEMRVVSKAKPKVVGTVEIAMVLDNSGSMNFSIDSDEERFVSPPNRRADSLQEAVSDMFDVIYSNPNVTPAVSVIPYSTSVDITDLYAENGTSAFQGANGYSLYGLGLSDFNPSDVTYQDHKDGKGVWAAERFVNKRGDGTYNLSLANPGSRSLPILSQTPLQTWCSYRYYYQYGTRCIQVSRGPNGVWYRGGYFKAYNGILGMTKNAQTVREYVASFEPQGGTAGHIGAAWGLYTLVPSWGGFFNHEAGKPQEFSDTTEKYLIIMTDGEFNSAQDSSMSNDDIFSYFSSTCAIARDSNVTIFTVGLKVEEDTKTDVSLRKCAGETGRYFSVDDHDSLKDAFKKIGRETGELRISS